MMRYALSAALLALAVGAVQPAQAQLRERKHDGFWIGFGVGGGENFNKNLDGDNLGGGAAYLRMGGTVSEQVLLGGEIIGWSRNENGGTLSRGNVTFTLLFYPGGGDFFLKGGLGGGTLQVSSTALGSTITQSENGAGATLGLGYDIRLGRTLYLTPNLDFLSQNVSNAGITTHNSITTLTIGLTWH